MEPDKFHGVGIFKTKENCLYGGNYETCKKENHGRSKEGNDGNGALFATVCLASNVENHQKNREKGRNSNKDLTEFWKVSCEERIHYIPPFQVLTSCTILGK